MNREPYEKRKKELSKLIKECESKLPMFPKGNLRISKDRNHLKYFLITDSKDTHGKYIRKEDQDIISSLAQREYTEKFLREARREYNAIEHFLNRSPEIKPEEIYDHLNDYRKPLITPLSLSDKEYAKQWSSASYLKNPYREEECIFETKKGDYVRSKSEAMIADMYYELGIPYRYESPLALKSGKIKYPDFTVLNVNTRKEIYHEHMGLFDEGNYRNANLIKIQDYMSSGIFVGKNLILTFESDAAPLNMISIRKMIKELFL